MPTHMRKLMANLNLPNPKLMDVAVPANIHQGLPSGGCGAQGFGLLAQEAKALIGRPEVVLIDLREKKERERTGADSRFAARPVWRASGQLSARPASSTNWRVRARRSSSIARSASAPRWRFRRRRIRASPQPGTSRAACRRGRRREARRIDLARGLSLASHQRLREDKASQPSRGRFHAQSQGQRHHDQLRDPRIGRAACPHPLSRRRQRLLRFPGRRLRQAFHLHLT